MNAYLASSIRSGLTEEVSNHLSDILIFETIPSTNQYLLDHSADLTSGTLCLATCQTAGRGRRGKTWQSPLGNLYMSVLWTAPVLQTMTILPLMVGVSLCQHLESYGIKAGVKWPNDIWVENKKLAGVLVESKIKKDQASLVIGLGLNIQSDPQLDAAVTQPWTGLDKIGIRTIDINRWVAGIINRLIPILTGLEQQTHRKFMATWKKYDLTYGQRIKIIEENKEVSGIAQGINRLGGLRVQIAGVITVYAAGEASLMLSADKE